MENIENKIKEIKEIEMRINLLYEEGKTAIQKIADAKIGGTMLGNFYEAHNDWIVSEEGKENQGKVIAEEKEKIKLFEEIKSEVGNNFLEENIIIRYAEHTDRNYDKKSKSDYLSNVIGEIFVKKIKKEFHLTILEIPTNSMFTTEDLIKKLNPILKNIRLKSKKKTSKNNNMIVVKST